MTVQSINLTTGARLLHKTLNCTAITPFLVAFDTINDMFIYQDTTHQLTIIHARNGTLVRVVDSVMIDVKESSAIHVDDSGNSLYALMTSSVNVVNLLTGSVKRLYPSADSSSLVGALTMSQNEIYYVLGPYSSYALVSQDKKTGSVDNIVPIRHDETGEILIPTNILYSVKHGALYGTLYSENTDRCVLAEIDEQSGGYRVVFDFYEQLGLSGRVMQHMATLDKSEKVLYGWFANAFGSTSKLFAISVTHGNILSMTDYFDQQGNWKAIGFIDCKN